MLLASTAPALPCRQPVNQQVNYPVADSWPVGYGHSRCGIKLNISYPWDGVALGLYPERGIGKKFIYFPVVSKFVVKINPSRIFSYINVHLSTFRGVVMCPRGPVWGQDENHYHLDVIVKPSPRMDQCITIFFNRNI